MNHFGKCSKTKFYSNSRSENNTPSCRDALIILYFYQQTLLINSNWIFFPPEFVPNKAMSNSHPTVRSPLSHNSHQPGRATAITCFFWDTWSQLTTSSRSVTHATSAGSIIHSEERVIRQFLCAWVQRCPWLACVALWLIRERQCLPSLPDNMVNFALLGFGLQMDVAL